MNTAHCALSTANRQLPTDMRFTAKCQPPTAN